MIKYKCSVCCKECVKFKQGSRCLNENNKVVSGKRCIDCALEYQRLKRNKNKNQVTKKYEKTKNGFIMRAYRNMLSRVSGIQIKKAHLYKDKEILSKNDFYEFSINDESFHKIFDAWELSGYDRRLSPSVDRMDSKKGYSIENMRWIEHWINSRNGTLSRYGKTDNIIDDKK